MSRQEYRVFRRSLPGGKKSKTWYVEFWDGSQEKYVDRRSTGEKRKDRATVKAVEWLSSGPPEKARSSCLTAAAYLGAFWDDDSPYVTMRRKRQGGKGISQQYVARQRAKVKGFFIPWLEERGYHNFPLSRLRGHHMEEFQAHLVRKAPEVSRVPNLWVNKTLDPVAAALARAAKLGLIESNPCTAIQPMEAERSRRTMMSAEEADRFFRGWEDDFYRPLNLLAAYSGMRKGEILGLLPEHIELQTIGAALVPVIHVVSNWVEGDGRKHPKMGSTRDVPIPMFVYDAIREVIKANP